MLRAWGLANVSAASVLSLHHLGGALLGNLNTFFERVHASANQLWVDDCGDWYDTDRNLCSVWWKGLGVTEVFG